MGSRWLLTGRIAHSHSSPVNPMTHVLNSSVYSVLTERTHKLARKTISLREVRLILLFLFFSIYRMQHTTIQILVIGARLSHLTAHGAVPPRARRAHRSRAEDPDAYSHRMRAIRYARMKWWCGTRPASTTTKLNRKHAN
jgi:hypothetical protein